MIQQRENVGIKFENLRLSSLRRVYEVVDFKRMLETSMGKTGNVTKNALADLYRKIKWSKYSEQVSATFIEYALNFHKTVLNEAGTARLCMQLDQLEMNPVDSLYKLREIAMMCDRKHAHIQWVLCMLYDNWTRLDAKDPVPIRALKDSEDREHVSIVRLYLFKRSLRDLLWRQMEVNYAWDSKVKQDLRKVTDTLATARSELGFHDEPEEQKAFPARTSWPASADAFLLMFEAAVYGYKLDGALIATLRHRKGVEDVLEHALIKQLGHTLN